MAEEIASLELERLAERHPGLTPAIAASYLEAACVCLSRHHQPPLLIAVVDDGLTTQVRVNWTPPNAAIQAAWANQIDTTEAGAYACAIAALELSRGLYAVRRAETLTGADYYIAPLNSDLDDLENCYRLEVSGTHLANIEVRRRLKVKLEQTRQGSSDLPAIAAVVGFSTALIMIQTLKDEP